MILPAERPRGRGRPRKSAPQPLPDLTPHPSWEAQHPPQGEAAPPPPPSAQAAQDLPPAIYKTLPQVPNIVGGNDFEPASSELDDAVARAMKVKT